MAATVGAAGIMRATVGAGPIYGQRAFGLESYVELLSFALLGVVAALVALGFKTVLAVLERWFDAHEALEDEWRDAPTAERDFLQGLVHVTVAWHHASRGNAPGASRQLAKAARRLGPYAPAHRGVDVARDELGRA